MAVDYGYQYELWSNQLELSLTSEVTPEDRRLGEVYVGRLVNQSTLASYFLFWRLIDRSDKPASAWRQSFLHAFGIGPEDFVSQVNKERRESLTDVTGQVLGEGARFGHLLEISAHSHLPGAVIYHYGTVRSDGTYSLLLPRHRRFELRVRLPASNCEAFVGPDGSLVPYEEALTRTAERQSEAGPSVTLPKGFCEQRVSANVTGLESDIPSGLKLEACSIESNICGVMRRWSDLGLTAVVPVPGPHIVRVTSDRHACPSYLSPSGLTSDRTMALPVDSSVRPVPTELLLDDESQYCDFAIRGRFTGRSPEWFEGKSLGAYSNLGGSPYWTTIDADGRFELPVPATGNYHFYFWTTVQHQHQRLSCNVSSGQAAQWSSRVTSPPLDDNNDIVVNSEAGADLHWEIRPNVCTEVVSGRVQSPTGDAYSELEFKVCPGGGGQCQSNRTGRYGDFTYLAGVVGDVVFSLQNLPGNSDICGREYWVSTRTAFTILPGTENDIVWTIPPNPCS